MTLANLLGRLVDWSQRRALAIVLVAVLAAILGALYSASHLGISTDTDAMFPQSLPWRAEQIALEREFPQFRSLLVVVINSHIPEAADATARQLTRALAADHTHFVHARDPSALPFFGKEGLLFLPKKQLEGLLNRLISAQPLLGQLVADPTGRGLFSALALLGMGLEHGGIDLAPYAPAFTAFHKTIAATLAGKPEPLSWIDLLSGPEENQTKLDHIVLVQPKLDFRSLEPGGAATKALRAEIAKLPFVRQGLVTVGVTGEVALADEQFASIAHGAALGIAASLALITLWLFLAAPTWRLVLPIGATLLLGLAYTTTFAALAVGTLNLISVAFAVLFVGIAVDFSIQFSVRFREIRYHSPDTASALRTTAGSVGSQILVAALGTAAGFLAFVPTHFQGVAELGLIAGVGMLIAFLCTILFLPACLRLCRPHGEPAEVGFLALRGVESALRRRARLIVAVAALLGVLGAVLVPHIRFDGDPLDTKNPHSEAVVVLRKLMHSPLTNPYSAEFVAPNEATAARLAEELRKLPEVGTVLSIDSFIPDDQNAKLAMIADAADILAPTLLASSPNTAVTAAELRLAIRTALGPLQTAISKLSANAPLATLTRDLQTLEASPDGVLMRASEALTRFLPDQLQRLATALSAAPVTAANLPPELKRDWVLPDGRTRVQALAKPNAHSSQGLARFVAAVHKIAPNAGGSAVNIVGSANVIVGAFRTATIGALIAIAIILALVLRRARDVGLVLAPLALSGLLTTLFIVLLPLPLNFANVIALPLLLGVGVSFNIYFVMNWRDGARTFLSSATARAIFFSALTTGTAFGSLALSEDRGTSSMGELLLVSLGLTLLVTLFFLPALLELVTPKKHETHR